MSRYRLVTINGDSSGIRTARHRATPVIKYVASVRRGSFHCSSVTTVVSPGPTDCPHSFWVNSRRHRVLNLHEVCRYRLVTINGERGRIRASSQVSAPVIEPVAGICGSSLQCRCVATVICAITAHGAHPNRIDICRHCIFYCNKRCSDGLVAVHSNGCTCVRS